VNRNFENRKPTKVYAKSKENKAVIKALNMYGRVPEMWELLEEIERLNNIINELEKFLNKRINFYHKTNITNYFENKDILDKLQELKGSYLYD